MKQIECLCTDVAGDNKDCHIHMLLYWEKEASKADKIENDRKEITRLGWLIRLLKGRKVSKK